VQTGTNLPAIGGYNQTVVLDAVRRHRSGLSRVELAQRTGLSAQTIGNVTRRLIESGLVRETGKLINGPGKPRTMLELEPAGRFAVGVHIDPAVITFVVLDLEGAVVGHSLARTPSAPDPDDVIELMARHIDELIADAGVDRSRVMGVGIASPGPIDLVAGVVLDPPMLRRWRDVPLRTALSHATGLPVLLEKDVTAAAVAELWFSASGTRTNFVFVYYGTGLGTGLVVGHEPVRGASANSGDFGHIVVDEGGPRCICGDHGCVGMLVTPAALVRDAVDTGVLDSRFRLAEGDADEIAKTDSGFAALVALAEAGDEGAAEVIRRAARRLARSIVVIINLLDLDEVILGGPFWAAIEPFMLRDLESAIASSAALIPKHPIAVVSSAIGADVAAIGAACLVLDHAFSPRPSAMLIAV